MTVQQLIDQLNEKVRTGEFLPSMEVHARFGMRIENFPFHCTDGKVVIKITDEAKIFEREWKPQIPGDR